MIFSEILADVKTISNVTGQDTLVKRAINQALNRVAQFHDFPYYIKFLRKDAGGITIACP